MAKVSLADVVKHSNADDCWVVVNGRVYDLTTFALSHPGGPQSEASAFSFFI